MAGDLITLPLRIWLRSALFLTRVAVGATERAVSLAGHAIQTVTPGGSDGGGAYAATQREEREAELDEREAELEEREAELEEREAERDEREAERARDGDEAQDAAPAEVSEPPLPRSEPPATGVAPLPSDPRREPVEPPVAPEPQLERPPVPREEPVPAPPPRDEPAHVSEEPELVREYAEPGAEEGAGAEVTVLEPWEGYARMNARDVIARARSASPAELAAVRLYESRNRARQTVLDAVDRQLKTMNGSGRPA